MSPSGATGAPNLLAAEDAALAVAGAPTESSLATDHGGAAPSDDIDDFILPPWRRHRGPFPGFRPFEIDEADIYFGRECQIDKLLDRLASSRFIAVAGPSGCGKSSLVKAGVLPAIRAGFLAKAGVRWRVAELRPGKEPMEALTDALRTSPALGTEYADSSRGALDATLRRGPLGLVQTVRQAGLAPKTNMLVLVDQFEEIFRHQDPRMRDEIEAFVDLLVTASQDDRAPIYVILTMRSDFIGECSTYPGLSEAVSAGLFLTPRMTREECANAIVSPARVFGANVDPALVNRLLNEMAAVSNQLPPLQHFLMRLWDVATRDRTTNAAEPPRPVVLTADLYKRVGTLEGALSDHANEALAELTSESDQQVAEVLFRSLVDVTLDNRRTRRPVSVATVAARAHTDTATVERVVSMFVREGRSFLVRSGPPVPSDRAVIDISHESLIKLWDRLRQWSDDEARWLRSRSSRVTEAVIARR